MGQAVVPEMVQRSTVYAVNDKVIGSCNARAISCRFAVLQDIPQPIPHLERDGRLAKARCRLEVEFAGACGTVGHLPPCVIPV